MNLATGCKKAISSAFAGVIAITAKKWGNTVSQPISQVDEHSLVEEANPVFIGNVTMEVKNG